MQSLTHHRMKCNIGIVIAIFICNIIVIIIESIRVALRPNSFIKPTAGVIHMVLDRMEDLVVDRADIGGLIIDINNQKCVILQSILNSGSCCKCRFICSYDRTCQIDL